MTADAHARLRELAGRHDLANDRCADCGSPHPQWASVSFAIFLCLQCAGVHRGFGVHVSFVRSVSMDAWQPDQLARMQLGGNAPFKHFVAPYFPSEQPPLDPHTLYHSWPATQYREKLDHALTGLPWSPSTPPPDLLTTPSRPSSAHGLRKARASARSPPVTHTATGNPPSASHLSKNATNEAYFAALGQANAARPSDVPPSQGGRYQGFGNTPSPPPSQHPSSSLSSNAAPSLADFQENPAAALSKGWSLFSAAVVGASRAVNENVIQPGIERVMDPALHASVRDYVSEAQRRAQLTGQSVNQWSKAQLGVDVADHVNGIVGAIKDNSGAGPRTSGYDPLPAGDDGETSALYDDTSDFFREYSDAPPASDVSTGKQAAGLHASRSPGGGEAKKDDGWDEWQDF